MSRTYAPGHPASRRPQPLAEGDQIAVIAPSSAFDREKFDRGIAALESIGFEPQLNDDLFATFPEQDPYLAGTDERRESELDAALAAPETKALVLARGGYGSLRFATQLREIPAKLVIGYSDATVLHEVWRRAGVPSIHGPMCTQLGEDPVALQGLKLLLEGKDPGPIEWQPQTARGGRTEAPLRGGNLASLASMCGTPLQPQFDGSIVLLEDLNEPPYRLDRLVTQLLLSGAFDGVKGFVIGDLVGPGEPSAGRNEAVAERLLTLEVPLVFGAPFGHAGRNQPVAFGIPHALDADKGRLKPLDRPTT